jgi:nicotinamide phosphoribosyltransferase
MAMNNEIKITDNVILNCDTYKVSHWMFMEEGTTFSQSYVEPRVGAKYDEIVFFGLQGILMDEFMKPVTMEMVDQAEEFLAKHLGSTEAFNRRGWEIIVNEYGGYLPIRIRAVKEGTVLPVGNAVIIVESTDPRFNTVWCSSYVETKIMRSWYGSTVATHSREITKAIREALNRTGTPDLASMKLVDFGSRGVSTKQESMVGGAAHLVTGTSTDNLLGIGYVEDVYGSENGMAGFSIPATEHSITTSWGELREFEFFKNIVTNILPKTGIASVVCDTYNLMAAIEMFGELREDIEKNGVIVIRPDSGDPVEMTEAVVQKLDSLFGSTVNDKGFKVLNDCVRIIQGDGIDLEMTKAILDNFERLGYSADNITFGSGGGLLRKVTRDTMRFAMKACHVIVDGEARDIRKVPLTDPSKASKAGRLTLVQDTVTGKYRTVNQHDTIRATEVDAMDTVFENGRLLRMQTFDDIRERAAIKDCPRRLDNVAA